jgi:hypothetical protein
VWLYVWVCVVLLNECVVAADGACRRRRGPCWSGRRAAEAAEVNPVPSSDAGEGTSATPAPTTAGEGPAPASAPTSEGALKVVAEPTAEPATEDP